MIRTQMYWGKVRCWQNVTNDTHAAAWKACGFGFLASHAHQASQTASESAHLPWQSLSKTLAETKDIKKLCTTVPSCSHCDWIPTKHFEDGFLEKSQGIRIPGLPRRGCAKASLQLQPVLDLHRHISLPVLHISPECLSTRSNNYDALDLQSGRISHVKCKPRHISDPSHAVPVARLHHLSTSDWQ